MTCPAIELLAAAVSGQAPELDGHLASCLTCAREVELQRTLITRARGIAVPAFTRSRRMALAAETLARAEARQHRGTWITIATAMAAAAAIAIVLGLPSLHEHVPTSTTPMVPIASDQVSVLEPPPPGPVSFERPAPPPTTTPPPIAPRPAALASSDGVLERAHVRGHDTIQFHDGTLLVDARDRAPVTLVAGEMTVIVADSRIKVVAVDNFVVSMHVLAGAVDVNNDKLAAGATWTPSVAPATSLAMFRAGWKALRDERYGAAIAAFDLARDPVVAEDAAYWAAVAASRAGRDREAHMRFDAFLAAFPDSTRADAARAAVAAIDP